MHWDDRENFVANALVRQSGWSSLATPVLGVFEPVSLLAKRLEYRLFGLNIQAYLAANVTLHCINCVLLCMLAQVLVSQHLKHPRQPTVAAMIATVWFATHPLRGEYSRLVRQILAVLTSLVCCQNS